MERKVGEIFEHNGEWYQCVKGESEEKCTDCFFKTSPICMDLKCLGNERKDHTKVIFKKLEKLGDPFERQGHFYQEYKAHTFPLLMNGGVKLPTPNGFAVIIKQNQEDMEEKKIQHYDCFFDKEQSKSNLKPFSFEAAKAGKPVCTRDRRKARIICFDKKVRFLMEKSFLLWLYYVINIVIKRLSSILLNMGKVGVMVTHQIVNL